MQVCWYVGMESFLSLKAPTGVSAKNTHPASGLSVPVSGESRGTQETVSVINRQPRACPYDGTETPNSNTVFTRELSEGTFGPE